MGKASYRPKKNHVYSEKQVDTINHMLEEAQLEEVVEPQHQLETEDGTNEMNDYMQEEINTDYEPLIKETIAVQVHKENTKKLDNLKVVGDMECDYHIYLEDYVYTYLYQYAFSNLSKESSAILVGEVYIDSKEAIIRGMIPIDMSKLSGDNEWLGPEIIEEVEEQRKVYFQDQDIIGWMHMQPGYGTMLTIKELREHRNVFEGSGSLFMLVDAINKIESVYVYEDDELKEQSGYCMYYERNEQMQQYMLDHPFAKKETEEIKDTVVNQFREIGKIRKEEYNKRRNVSLTAFAAAIVLITLTGVVMRINGGFKGNGNDLVQDSVALQNELDNRQVVDDLNLNIENNGEVASNTQLEAAQEVFAEAQRQGAEGENTEQIAPTEGEVATNAENGQVSNHEQVAANVDKGAKEGVVSNEAVDTSAQQEVVGANEKEEVTVVSEQVDENQKNASEDYEVYIVKAGDTLANISFSVYGDASKSIEVAKLNGLDNTNQIYVGQKLKLPEK